MKGMYLSKGRRAGADPAKIPIMSSRTVQMAILPDWRIKFWESRARR